MRQDMPTIVGQQIVGFRSPVRPVPTVAHRGNESFDSVAFPGNFNGTRHHPGPSNARRSPPASSHQGPSPPGSPVLGWFQSSTYGY